MLRICHGLALTGFALFATQINTVASGQTFTEGDIPLQLLNGGTRSSIRKGYQEGSVKLSAITKEVTINWQACGLLNGAQPVSGTVIDFITNSIDGHTWRQADQSFRVDYFPTSVAATSEDTLLVAGIKDDGNTIIEKWKFVWSSPMPGKITDPTTGITHVNVATPTRERATVIFDQDAIGKKHVRNMCRVIRPNAGGPDLPAERNATHAFVMFHDSGDLYKMLIDDGSMTLIMSGTAAVGQIPAIPALTTQSHYCLQEFPHSTEGFTYTLVPGLGDHRVSPDLQPYEYVILKDSNKDGNVESVIVLNGADYLAQGWMNMNNYDHWWLY